MVFVILSSHIELNARVLKLLYRSPTKVGVRTYNAPCCYIFLSFFLCLTLIVCLLGESAYVCRRNKNWIKPDKDIVVLRTSNNGGGMLRKLHFLKRPGIFDVRFSYVFLRDVRQ